MPHDFFCTCENCLKARANGANVENQRAAKRHPPRWVIEKRKAGLKPTKREVNAALDFLGTLKKGSDNGDDKSE